MTVLGPDTRFIVTNLAKRNARSLYEDVYCRRGQAENHIKAFKTHLAADRTSSTKASANQLRLFLHAGAYWLMWGLRESMPKRSMWRVAQDRYEDNDSRASADLVPRSGRLALRPFANPAPRHLTHRA